MIPRRFEAVGQSPKDRGRVMADLARFTVHQVRRANHSPSECLAYCLVPEAYAKNWKLPRKLANQGDRDSSGFGHTRAWRDQQTLWLHLAYLIDCDLVVS